MTVCELINSIRPVNREDLKKCREYWDCLAKPLGSLGLLEDGITRMAALRGQAKQNLNRATLLVLCADNGVVSQGVSQSDSSVTTAVAKALGEGSSTVNYMAASALCQVRAVNIGMKDPTPLKGVENRCIREGTGDISLGPAMTRQECEKAILTGAYLAFEEADKGTDVLLLGEMGIGNTTTSTAVGCALLHKDPGTLTGRGAGLSDAGLARKVKAIERALEANCPDGDDPVDVLAKVGGLDLAALCGVCLGAAERRIPVILDGMITCVAGLCAVRLCPGCIDVLIPSHVSQEPATKLILKEMDLKAPIDANLRLGEGTGAVLALSLYRQVLAVYNSGHTFEHLGIEAYQKL